MADRRADRSRPQQARQAPVDPRLVCEAAPPPLARIAAIVGWCGVGVVIAALFWWAIAGLPLTPIKVMIGAGGAAILFWVAANFAAVRESARGRRFQVGLNSTAFSVFVLGIIVLLNFVVYRHNHVKDMTAGRLYSLSPQTADTVAGLDRDVQFIVFMDTPSMQNEDGKRVMQRLREYERHSRHLKVEFKDPYDEPDLVKEYEIQVLAPVQDFPAANAAVAVRSGERHDTVMGAAEADLTNAIMRVTTDEKPKVYVLMGNGEFPLDAPGGTDMSLSGLKAALERQQYVVEPLYLAKSEAPRVPDDCRVLVIAGPTRPLPQEHMEALRAYLQGGGRLLLAISAGMPELRGERHSPDFGELLKPYGVEPLRGVVVDLASMATDKTIPAITEFGDHPIVQGLQLVALPTTTALQVEEPPPPPAYPGAPPPPPQRAQPLLKSSAQAWLETSPDPAQIGPSAGKPRGPLTLAAAVDEGAAPQLPGMAAAAPGAASTRIVAFGDADFLTDRYNQLQLEGNKDLALKSIAWLSARENLVSIPPKRDTPRFMTMKRSQRWAATIVSLFLLPGAILVTGGLVWFVRRRG